MLARAFAEEQTPPKEDRSSENREPEYTFEGFTIEFSKKIMLTAPAAASRTVQAQRPVGP
jgi:hypothetical protein